SSPPRIRRRSGPRCFAFTPMLSSGGQRDRPASAIVHILVLNVGSSTLKFQLIDTDEASVAQATDRRLAGGQIERIGGEAIVTLKAGGRAKQKDGAPARDAAPGL